MTDHFTIDLLQSFCISIGFCGEKRIQEIGVKAFQTLAESNHFRKVRLRIQRSDSDKTYHLTNLFPQDKLWWARIRCCRYIERPPNMNIITWRCTHEWIPLKRERYYEIIQKQKFMCKFLELLYDFMWII